MKLYLVPLDKAQHILYGSAIACVTTVLWLLLAINGFPSLMFYLPVIGLWAAILTGIAKEVVDYFYKSGTPDVFDFLTTVLGGLFVSLPILLITIL